jgi:hypothetical protein
MVFCKSSKIVLAETRLAKFLKEPTALTRLLLCVVGGEGSTLKLLPLMLHLVNSYECLLGKSAVVVQISPKKYIIGLFLAKTIPNRFEYTLKFIL